MTAVNSVLSFAAMPSLPYGGVGDSGFGRLAGDDGLREFAPSKVHHGPPGAVAAAALDL